MTVANTSADAEERAGQSRELVPLISTEATRAINHRAKLETEDSPGNLIAIPNLLSRFSLIPVSKQTGTFYKRTNDFATVTITPGVVHNEKGEAEQGEIPSGGMANLSLMWMVHQVRQNLKREVDNPAFIDLGSNRAQFLHSLGINKGGNQYRAANKTLRSVLSATIELHDLRAETRNGMAGRTHSMQRAHVSDSFELWESDGNELDGFQPYAIAARNMMILAADPEAAPARLDLLAQLVKSPLAQQALNWLSSRVFALNKSNRQFDEYTYETLFRNITHEYSDERTFRRAWKSAVLKAVEHFPAVRTYLDLDAVPEMGKGSSRVIRLNRGSRLLIPEKEFRQLSIG